MTEFSIGKLSKLTGLSVLRLRAWETRYNYPMPVKLDSGHRRYSMATLQKLQAIQRLLEFGEKISFIVHMEISELYELLDKKVAAIQVPEDFDKGAVLEWLEVAKEFDEVTLNYLFEKSWNKFTPLGFIESRVGPFVYGLGEYWESEYLNVSQEHFASNTLRNFLENKWRAKNLELKGRPFVLSMLPNDHHNLGLQMCALLTCEAGQPVRYLGERTPVESIISCAESTNATAIVISISETLDERMTRTYLQQLAQWNNDDVVLIAGGKGYIEEPNFKSFATFKEYEQWIKPSE